MEECQVQALGQNPQILCSRSHLPPVGLLLSFPICAVGFWRLPQRVIERVKWLHYTKHLERCLDHGECSVSPGNDDGDGDDDGRTQAEEKAEAQEEQGNGFRALMASPASRSN